MDIALDDTVTAIDVTVWDVNGNAYAPGDQYGYYSTNISGDQFQLLYAPTQTEEPKLSYLIAM